MNRINLTKVLAIMLTLVISVSFVACKKEKTDLNKEIIGTWKMSYTSHYFLPDGAKEKILKDRHEESSVILEFKSDGKIYAEDSPPVSYAVSKGKLVLSKTFFGEDADSEYDVNADGNVICEIQKLDAHNLSFIAKYKDKYEVDGKIGYVYEGWEFVK